MRVMFAGDRPQERDEGRQAALRAGFDCAAGDCVSLADVRFRLSREPLPHLVVLYMGDDLERGVPLVRAAAAEATQPVYAVVGGANFDRIDAAALGVRAVWRPEGVREGLLTSANQLRRAGQAPDSRGRVVAVASAQPGVGVTTIACGLAFGLAKAGGPVALAELTAGTPELALDLDLNPQYSLGELIRESDRADVSMLRRAAVPHKAGVSVLAYTPDTLVPEEVTTGLARDFHILLRSGFAWSVVDAGHGVAPGLIELLAQADAVAVVTRMDTPSLRLAKRYVAELADRKVPVEDLVVLANRYGQSGLVNWKKAEESLRRKVAAWLPDDPGSVNAALRDGRPLVEAAPRAALTRELNRVAAELQARFASAPR